MAQSGYIGTSKQIKEQLQELNRDYYNNQTWKDLYSTIDLNKQTMMADLKYDYASAINEAYSSYLQQNDMISSSSLGQGYKQQLFDDNTLALEQAYDTYKQNYMNSLSKVNTMTTSAAQSVDEALTYQAENTEKMTYKPYEYLQALYKYYDEQGTLEDSIFFTSNLYNHYVKNIGTEEAPEYALKTWDEITASGQKDTETGEWLGMFDADGNLTSKGVDFYDQMFNAASTTKTSLPFTFDTWLKENDAELYQWSHEYNPYDYTLAGSNFGSFKTMVGMTSTDYEYSFKERFGGFTKKRVDEIFSEVETKTLELADIITDKNGRNIDETIKSYENLLGEVKTLLTDLDLLEDFTEEAGINFDDFAKQLAAAMAGSKSQGDLWLEGLGRTVSGLGAGTIGGAGVGSAIGISIAAPIPVPGARAIGAGVGAILGGIAGVIVGTVGGIGSAISNAVNAHETNRAIAENVKGQFNNLMNQLITYRQYKQREIEIQDYKNRKI